MRFLTLFSSSSFFLLSKEEVILSCNLQEPRRITHLLSSPNKSSTSIHHTKVTFPYKRVSEVIKSFEFEFKKIQSSTHPEYVSKKNVPLGLT